MGQKPRQLDASFLRPGGRPVPRILQFGGGSFMRAFLDYKIDVMNESSNGDWGVVVVSTVADPEPQTLNSQDGLYTVIERGPDATGNELSSTRMIRSVLAELFSQRDWSTVLALARRPQISVITSNVTDAGYLLDNWDLYDDRPPKSFPAKLARLLHERWKYLGRVRNGGCQIIPCELVDDNGSRLAEMVEQQARIWGLEPAFLKWLHSANTFYNTLANRIVAGFPYGEEQSLAAELGYEDRFMVVAERFHFLAIERRPGQPELVLPLAEHDAGTVITADIEPYRSRWSSTLKGAHTALRPPASVAEFGALH